MLYKTHVATSVTLGTGLAIMTEQPFSVPFVAGIALGSLLPDIDEPQSFIGQRSLGISKMVKEVFGHRGFTHSLFAWMIVTIICLMFVHPFTLGIASGYLFHLMGDLFSKSGLSLFLPFNKVKVKFPFGYRTGGKVEEIIRILSMTAFLYLVFTNPRLINEFLTSLLDLISKIINWF